MTCNSCKNFVNYGSGAMFCCRGLFDVHFATRLECAVLVELAVICPFYVKSSFDVDDREVGR